MDSIEFIKINLGIPTEDDLVDHFETRVPLDTVIRLVQRSLECHWYYTKNGEFPYDSSTLGDDKMCLTEEVLVQFYGGPFAVLQFHANGKDFGEDLWMDQSTGEKYYLYSVKCWRFFTNPQL